MRTINEITLYELMAEDFSVWVSKNDKFGFNLHIEGDDCTLAVQEEEVHPCAMEGFADVCRRFLHFYEKAKLQSEDDDMLRAA